MSMPFSDSLQFDSFQTAWEMAGHGSYVWASYVLFTVVLVALIWSPLARQRRLLREVRDAERRREARAPMSETKVSTKKAVSEFPDDSQQKSQA